MTTIVENRIKSSKETSTPHLYPLIKLLVDLKDIRHLLSSSSEEKSEYLVPCPYKSGEECLPSMLSH